MILKEDSKWNTSLRLKILIVLISIILIVFMFPRGESIESEVSIGSVWIQNDLIADFSFPINKNKDIYNLELKIAAESVYPIFIFDDQILANSIDSLESYHKYLIEIIDKDIQNENLDRLNPTFFTDDVYKTIVSLRLQERSVTRSGKIKLSDIVLMTTNSINYIYRLGVLNKLYSEISKDSIAIRTGNFDRIEPKRNFLDSETFKESLKQHISELNINQEYSQIISEYSRHFIKPNILYSEEETKIEIEQAQNKVSRFIGIVNENERIIAKHERISPEVKLKIDSYRESKGEQIGTDELLLQLFGKFLHISFILAFFSIYIYLFRKKIYYSNNKILLILIVFVFVSFVTYLVNQITVTAPIHFLIFIPAAAMLFAIIFDSRVGFYSTVVLSLIIGALRGNDYTFVALSIFAGALAVYTVRDIKNRSQIFRSFGFILLGYGIAILAFGLERFETWEKILIEFAFAGTNAVISPVLTYGLLIFFERIFKITTDLTLLELSNFDRPLLRDLARKAPGTFNHSITMGTLAETAAEAINGNPLLARVGAYYHDIGKSINPINFVENQLNNKNIHENLTPQESVKAIKEHISMGVELGKESNLPNEILEFIPMHHGTTLISFFYEKAKEQNPDIELNINDFRYSGPKPQTKETAIIMLADGCESAVRSIDSPDPEKVEKIIDNIFKSRIDDGQLDESPVTIADLKKIKEAFMNILLGQHHRRIRYPKQDEVESSK